MPTTTTSLVPVSLADGRVYDIHIGSGLIADAGRLCAPFARGGRVLILSQPPIARHYAEPLAESLAAAGIAVHQATFPNGERSKTLATVSRLYRVLYDLRADRKMLIIALGGGVVGDVAGFVAASYLRGLDFIQIPTTLLAMVDSSVGGKTGVDFQDGKNLIGAFHQPRLVLADTDVLATLSARDRRSGMAEVIKYGFIREPGLLTRTGDLAHIIERSCAIKAAVVAGDEREETGLRAILNFGHTIGHALEAATRYRRYRHGEAIAIGMVSAACIGEAVGVTPASVRDAIVDAVRAQCLPTALPTDVADDDLLDLLSRDKKAEQGRARFILARALGDVDVYATVTDAAIRSGLTRQRREYASDVA